MASVVSFFEKDRRSSDDSRSEVMADSIDCILRFKSSKFEPIFSRCFELSLALMPSILLFIMSIDSQLSFSNLRQISNTLCSSEQLIFEFDLNFSIDSLNDLQWAESPVTSDDIVRNCSEFDSVIFSGRSTFIVDGCVILLGGCVILTLVDFSALVIVDRIVCRRFVFVSIDFVRASDDGVEKVDFLLCQ